MNEPVIHDFHAHVYFNRQEIELAREVASEAALRFGLRLGHFHERPVGPHPRGSVQLTVPVDRFGDLAQWLVLNRRALTIFAHANSGNDRMDHTDHVIWFGPSEPLDLSNFD